MKKFKFIFLVLYLIVLAAGLTSEPSLGDEVYHYRFAKNFYWQETRPVVDILYQNDKNNLGVPYYYDMLWHFVLSRIWKIIGSISFIAAQIYHSLYYLLLILVTYFLGKELYGEETGLYSALIMATVPMIAAFSIIFYIDVPSAFFSTLCILLIIKNKFFWSGVTLGLMYLTKRNTLMFFPAILFIILYNNKSNFKIKLRGLLIMFIVSAAIIFPDLYWRDKNFKKFGPNIFTSGEYILKYVSAVFKGKFIALYSDENLITEKFDLIDKLLGKSSSYIETEFGDMKTFINILSKDFKFVKYFKNFIFLSYFGFAIFVSLFFYFVFRKFRKKDFILWALVANYIFFYLSVLEFSNEMRYVLPIIPFFSILAAIPIASSKNFFLKNAIICVCLAQFLTASVYVGMKRRIPHEIKDGFAFIRQSTPLDANIFYVEHLALDNTNRKTALPHIGDPLLIKMFWSQDQKEVLSSIEEMDIDYIMVKKSRIYDDTDRYYFSGYPRSFIERLPKLSFVKLVFENKEMSIWEIYRKNKL